MVTKITLPWKPQQLEEQNCAWDRLHKTLYLANNLFSPAFIGMTRLTKTRILTSCREVCICPAANEGKPRHNWSVCELRPLLRLYWHTFITDFVSKKSKFILGQNWVSGIIKNKNVDTIFNVDVMLCFIWNYVTTSNNKLCIDIFRTKASLVRLVINICKVLRML